MGSFLQIYPAEGWLLLTSAATIFSTPHSSLLTPHSSLLTTYFLLLTSYHLLPTHRPLTYPTTNVHPVCYPKTDNTGNQWNWLCGFPHVHHQTMYWRGHHGG